MLHANPEFVHFSKIVHQEIDAINRFIAILAADVWQLVACALQQIVAQKQAAHRLLHAAAHFHEVLENVTRRRFLAPDVHAADSDEEEKTRHNIARVLHELIELDHAPPTTHFVVKVLLEMTHLISDHDVQLIKVFR